MAPTRFKPFIFFCQSMLVVPCKHRWLLQVSGRGFICGTTAETREDMHRGVGIAEISKSVFNFVLYTTSRLAMESPSVQYFAFESARGPTRQTHVSSSAKGQPEQQETMIGLKPERGFRTQQGRRFLGRRSRGFRIAVSCSRWKGPHFDACSHLLQY